MKTRVFLYDGSFEGILTAVFDAYVFREFPDGLAAAGEPLPLFCKPLRSIASDAGKADRVWRGLKRRLSGRGLFVLRAVWLSGTEESADLLFRYIRKIFDAPAGAEFNFGDPDILPAVQLARKVARERERTAQFIRFRRLEDGTWFCGIDPVYDVLPLVLEHLCGRFAGQCWLVYDLRRHYGYYFSGGNFAEVRFSAGEPVFLGRLRRTGRLPESLLEKNERLFQQLWRSYYHSASIRERLNSGAQRRNMPVRFWKFLPEKQ